MKILKLSTLAIILLAAGAHTANAQNADEIINKHIAAIGGLEKWNKIKTIKFVGGMDAGGMQVNMTETVVSGKAMRMDITAMGMDGYTIVTQKEGWIYMPFAPGMDKVTPLTEDQVKDSKDKLDITQGQLVDKSKISKSEYAGRDTVKNISCYKVKIITTDGNEATAFFDAATYYMVHMDMKAKVQDQEQEVAVDYSNFQKQPDGVVIPMTIGTERGDVVFKSVEINKHVDESIFKPTEPKKVIPADPNETEPPKKELSPAK